MRRKEGRDYKESKKESSLSHVSLVSDFGFGRKGR